MLFFRLMTNHSLSSRNLPITIGGFFYFWIFSKVFEKNFKKLKNQGVQNPKKFLFLDERVKLMLLRRCPLLVLWQSNTSIPDTFSLLSAHVDEPIHQIESRKEQRRRRWQAERIMILPSSHSLKQWGRLVRTTEEVDFFINYSWWKSKSYEGQGHDRPVCSRPRDIEDKYRSKFRTID